MILVSVHIFLMLDLKKIVEHVDIAGEILKFCNYDSFESLSMSCKRWYNIVKNYFIQTRGLEILKIEKVFYLLSRFTTAYQLAKIIL